METKDHILSLFNLTTRNFSVLYCKILGDNLIVYLTESLKGQYVSNIKICIFIEAT